MFLFLRVFLILAMLLHPFCRHCFAGIGEMSAPAYHSPFKVPVDHTPGGKLPVHNNNIVCTKVLGTKPSRSGLEQNRESGQSLASMIYFKTPDLQGAFFLVPKELLTLIGVDSLYLLFRVWRN